MISLLPYSKILTIFFKSWYIKDTLQNERGFYENNNQEVNIADIFNCIKTECSSQSYAIPSLNKELSEFEVILQNPELPSGCEITALAQTLKFYGFNISKTQLSEDYLIYGYGYNSLDSHFIGDPKSESGYECNAPVIVEAANKYFEDNQSYYFALDISGTDINDIYKYTDESVPVIVWATIGMVEPVKKYLWTTKSGEEVYFYTNEHCITLIGYDDDYVLIADPLEGKKKYKRSLFEKRYLQLQKQAIIFFDE